MVWDKILVNCLDYLFFILSVSVYGRYFLNSFGVCLVLFIVFRWCFFVIERYWWKFLILFMICWLNWVGVFRRWKKIMFIVVMMIIRNVRVVLFWIIKMFKIIILVRKNGVVNVVIVIVVFKLDKWWKGDVMIVF